MKGFICLSVLVIWCHRVSAVGFDAKAQCIDTTGEHAFVPPGPNDMRGLCPGLNTLANHNYIPHNGVATITQFTEAVSEVFGMGVDLALLLSIYGAVFVGDLTKFSIHGPTPWVPVPSPLGPATGISCSHNNYEGDYSPSRPDLYLAKQAYLLNPEQYIALRGDRKSYDLDYLTEFRARRYNASLHENPWFFNGVFSGLFVNPAAYTFIYRLMANRSREFPEGLLVPHVLDSFFSVKKDENGAFVYTPGHERIPDNWCRRAYGDEYTIPYFLGDVLEAAKKHPEFLSIGGNTGTVNSFVGVNIKDLTGGVYNSKNLLKGNNFFCFFYQLMRMTPNKVEAPQIQAINSFDEFMGQGSIFSKRFSCPQLESLDPIAQRKLFEKYPGFTDLQPDC